MNDHEPDEVYQHFGMDWINSHFKYVKRNFNYAQDRVHFEKWESFMAGKGWRRTVEVWAKEDLKAQRRRPCQD